MAYHFFKIFNPDVREEPSGQYGFVFTGVIVTPPPFSFFTRTRVTPFILEGFCFFKKRVSAALIRFGALFFFFFLAIN